MFGHDVSFNSFIMGKRGRDAAAADYKPAGMDRSEGSLPEKIPIPWAQGFDLRAVFQSLAR